MAIERFLQVEDLGDGDFDISVVDASNITIEELTTAMIETFDNSGPWDESLVTIAIRAATGTLLSLSGKANGFFRTDADGILKISITKITEDPLAGHITIRPFGEFVTNRAVLEIEL